MQERREYVTRLQPMMTLSRDVVNPEGRLILSRGTVLTMSQIVRLKQHGVAVVYVQEGENEESLSKPMLQERTMECYRESLQVVQQLFARARQAQRVEPDMLLRAMQDLEAACSEEPNFLYVVANLRTLDDYTMQHSIGVGLLAARIGDWLNLSEEDCRDLLVAGALHDIGKARIDPRILNKPARLTAEEYEIVKWHTTYGYQILRQSGLPEALALPAYTHHERMDGSGYPRGLRGEAIDLYGRIVAVADVFNAMTSRRVYRDACSYYKVLDEVQQNAFGTLDPTIVRVFMQRMTNYLVGNVVGLSDGTVGTVVMIHSDRPTRPLLRTENGYLDLGKRPDLYIEEVRAI
jgi:putative nucleotidyltransferase with HDIG domain